jgi:arylsulfatase A-like enzyme
VLPNVLLVVMDAARRDAMTPYGAPPSATPAIDEVARRGRAVPRAYATSSWTLPSHASLFTGLLPRTLGLAQPPGGDPASARPLLARAADRLLPAVLREAGYRTHGFSANLWASGRAGFDTGFDSFTYRPVDRAQRGWALEALRARTDDGAAAIREALTQSIAQTAPGAPALWFVNLVECHSPYVPPRPFNDLGALERVRGARDSRRYLGFEAICLQVARRSAIPEGSLQRMRHLYAQAVSYMDAWLADILGALDAAGMLEETLVIVTADHGESFLEDGLVAHGFGLGEQLIHVPLVMAGPGADTVGDEVFSLARLPGVIGTSAGLEGQPWGDRDLPAGVAVAQYDGISAADDPRIVAFAQKWSLGEDEVRRLTAGFTAVTDGRHKLVTDDRGAEWLYDLEADPFERAPLSDAGVADRLRAALAGGAAPFADDRPTREAAMPAASPDEIAALERQMRQLGYM